MFLQPLNESVNSVADIFATKSVSINLLHIYLITGITLTDIILF